MENKLGSIGHSQAGYEKLHDCWDEYVSLAEEAIFEYAFKLGMKIAIESVIDD